MGELLIDCWGFDSDQKAEGSTHLTVSQSVDRLSFASLEWHRLIISRGLKLRWVCWCAASFIWRLGLRLATCVADI